MLSKQVLLKILFLAAMVIALPKNVSAGPSQKLNTILVKELNRVLAMYSGVQQGLYKQDEERTDVAVRELMYQINHAKSQLKLAPAHERGHLKRILDSAYEHFELTQSTYGKERLQHFVEGTNQIVNIARIYRVNRGFHIFFCGKDSMSWVQTSTRPQNPFHGELSREPASNNGSTKAIRECGIRVQN